MTETLTSIDPTIGFAVDPGSYRHWSVAYDGPVATVTLVVDPDAGLRGDYQLKMNSYDLGVDIELNDIVQRLRFEHPEVKAVVVTGGLDKIFCAGANIQMLAGSTHEHKVNFCKFTNETRNGIEDATANSQQVWIAAVNGTAAGGGYELALACDEILLIDDRSSAVSLPEIPLLAVLPGTGGLTRVVDKRFVRRDLADAFATRNEGIKGEAALQWNLVDAIAPASSFDDLVAERAGARASGSDRPDDAQGVELTPLRPTILDDSIAYSNVTVTIDRSIGTATFEVRGPGAPQLRYRRGAGGYGRRRLAVRHRSRTRRCDPPPPFQRDEDRHVAVPVGGRRRRVVAAEHVLAADPDHWFVREVRLFWARTLKRLDVSARTLVTTIDPGSCFAGVLAELVLVADRSYMLTGTWEDLDDPPAPATVRLTVANDGWFPMSNGLTRLHTRFWGRDDALAVARGVIGADLDAEAASAAELVTFTPDDLDWEDEIRIMLEERNSFSPDALTGMEANYRFVGPETMETKIFSRLSAWQNWIFQRPNAVGPDGALRRFGTGSRPDYDPNRV